MSGFFGGKKSVNPAAPVISSIRIQTSSSGRPIPVVFGCTRLAGNLVWYGDFTPIANTTVQASGGKGSGGGKQSSTSYTYVASVIIGLCEGQIASVGTVWKDKEVHNLSELHLSLYNGWALQTPDPNMVTKHPSEALAYRNTAYLISTGYLLDDQAGLPNHTFEVNGLAQYGEGIVDANPKDVLQTVLTNANFGMGFDPSSIGDLTQFSNYCIANGIFISPAYTEQETAHDVVDRLSQIGNAGFVWSEDKLKVVPYADESVTGNGVTFTPNLTPLYDLGDDDYLGSASDDPVSATRTTQADAFNQLTVKFYNRANAYAEEPAEFKDQANIEMYGLRPGNPLDLDEIVLPSVARTVVQLIGQRTLYQRNQYQFRLGWKYALLEPMDIVTLADVAMGLTQAAVRILEIEEDEFGTLTVTAEDVLSGVHSHAIYESQATGGYNADYNTPAGSINPPVIFDSPGAIAALGYELILGVSGGANWGGCDIWVSTDNATYKQVGSIHGPSRHGALSATFAKGVDPDIADVCNVDLTVSRGELISGTQADADNLSTLCYVGGEIIAYKTAQLIGTNQYSLKDYIRRGLYNTPITKHLAGTPFLRIDQAIGKYAYDRTLVGSTIWLKFPSFNVYGSGNESIADVPAYQYTIKGPLGAPKAMTDLAVAGTVLTWTAVPDLTYRFRMHFGSNTDWGTATPLHSGTVGTSPFDLVSLPYASITILGKSVDKYGVESLDFATIFTDLGDAPIANIVETYPISPDFSGTIENCLLIGGELVANAADSFYGDDAASFYGLDNDSFYKPSAGFARMVYTTDVIEIAKVLAGSNMTLSILTVGTDVTIEYCVANEGADSRNLYAPPADAFAAVSTDFNALDPNSYAVIDVAHFNAMNPSSFSAVDTETFTPPPPVDAMGEWKPWPRSIVAKPTKYQFRVTIGSGSAPGKIQSMSLAIDAPDLTEGVGNLEISASGTLIPYTKPFYKIKFITFGALEPGTSGATHLKTDRTDPLKPVVYALNNSEVAVSGAKIDAFIGGY